MNLLDSELAPYINADMTRKIAEDVFKLSKNILSDSGKCSFFLSMRLCYLESQSKLEYIHHILKHDPDLTDLMPYKYFKLLQSYHVNLYRFRSVERHAITSMINSFYEMDVDTLLQDGSKMPLKITLKGIQAPGWPKSGICCLDASVQDSTGRYGNLCHGIRHYFTAKGHPHHTVALQSSDEYDVSQGSKLLDFGNNHRVRYGVRQSLGVDVKLRQQMFEPPLKECLLDRYRHTIWIDDLHVKKLSLCKAERQAKFDGPNNETILDERYEEIASIDLP